MMLESLACGTPVIGSSVGGIAETLANGLNGLLCEADDMIGFGRALQGLLVSSGGKSEQMRKVAGISQNLGLITPIRPKNIYPFTAV
jgi:glycosyltransferase involved in cell wall biosynthesis